MTQKGTDIQARDLLALIRDQYPTSPFLALGQTVFWDEPVKAVLRRLLDLHDLGGHLVLGVHDTDYFAKANLPRSGAGRFALMPHNDGSTKSLWSAAGEISALFGSETFPTRQDYIQHGVAFKRLADSDPAGRQAFLDKMTEAWGWRGLVYTGSRDRVVSRLPLSDVGEGILEMLSWGFENTLAQIVPGCCQDEARRVAETIEGWCRDYITQNRSATLSHLFQHVLPRLYTLLLGYEATQIEVTGTSDLLRLTPDTSDLPRFRFADLFLNPNTRNLALDAYNNALSGSEMYTLDRFGAGALPFDCVVPGRGRGTLRILPRVLFVETRQPIAIGLKRPIESIRDLAETLCAHLGDRVTLVGKAVSLVSMLAQEFIFVFNEEGSLYVRRTRQMNDQLRAAGVALDMRPILRLRYHTWDALEMGCSTLLPTEHLARTFGQQSIATPEFAASWRQVRREQRALCEEIRLLRRPLDLLRFLRARDPGTDWDQRIASYQSAMQTLCSLHERAQEVQQQIDTLRDTLQNLKTRGLAAQQERGAHFRSVKEWTPVAVARRAAFEGELDAVERHKRLARAEIAVRRAQRAEIERGMEAQQARNELTRLMTEAESARLRLVRYALLTIDGLEHTNHRPSAWWLPMVDPSGAWFRRIVETTEIYTEPLLS